MELVNIRKGEEKDMVAVHALICELAVYEKQPKAVEVTIDQLVEDGFGARPAFEVMVADKAGEVIGFALYYIRYSTWKGRCLYLEDFFVNEKYRREGIGAMLFEATIATARKKGAKRMDWQVLNWNVPAINFYKKYNALLDDEWLNGRVDVVTSDHF